MRKYMPYINGTYYTEEQIAEIKSVLNDNDFEKFLISGIIGFATGSSIVGGLLGGDLLGGLMGDLLEGDDDSIF